MELGFSLLRLANEEEDDDFKVPESIKDANEVSGMSDFFSPLAFMIVVFVTPRNCDFAVAFRFVLCTFCKPLEEEEERQAESASAMARLVLLAGKLCCLHKACSSFLGIL